MGLILLREVVAFPVMFVQRITGNVQQYNPSRDTCILCHVLVYVLSVQVLLYVLHPES
jgi:hypothetical protein